MSIMRTSINHVTFKLSCPRYEILIYTTRKYDFARERRGAYTVKILRDETLGRHRCR